MSHGRPWHAYTLRISSRLYCRLCQLFFPPWCVERPAKCLLLWHHFLI